MKKIGILTYHTGFNYGASLQAFSLQTVVSKFYPETEIINFEKEEFVSSREMFPKHPKKLKDFVKIISRLPYKKNLKKREYLFNNFTQNYLRLSELYRSEEDVVKNSMNYDCIICGSDQIWNLDKKAAGPAANLIYFLNFDKHQKRVSYAASFGRFVNIADNYENDFIPWLHQFDCVSVREQSGVDYLKKKGIAAKLVLDPTLLLDKNDYDLICSERLIPDNYILVFSWDGNKNVISIAKKLAKHFNLGIYTIVPPPRTLFSGIKRKLDVGPREFLSLIKYSSIVVSNSFHGNAFAITYEKPLVSVYNENPDPRMESMLCKLGMDSSLVNDYSKIDLNKILNYDYSHINEEKRSLRKESFDYLRESLEVISND